MRIPAPNAHSVDVRIASLLARDHFDPAQWPRTPMTPANDGWWTLDLAALGLADGDYEYDLIVDGNLARPIADPFATEITRFGGYRGIARIRNGALWTQPFDWSDELTAHAPLAPNERLVIYEMPLRWMDSAEEARQVGLGTFDKAIFEHLDEIADLGVTAIELLPIFDSADTLNWGYGSRFFFAPDYDMGTPVDTKLFIKRCHQRGIRVILDVVMNHARECPLEELADEWFLLPHGQQEEERGDDYGARLFRYVKPFGGHFPAREFHFAVTEHWIREYHVDGFRLDEFKGINHWEFVQQFRERATAAFAQQFPGRPFVIIAEDSWQRPVAAKDAATNPNGRRVVDALWSFSFRDEVRRTMRNAPELGEGGRGERVNQMIGGWRKWDGFGHAFGEGAGTLAQAVHYVTSHDVEKYEEERLFNHLFAPMIGSNDFDVIRRIVDDIDRQPPDVQARHARALNAVRGAFALMLTSRGMAMFLAGEEFADVHDTFNGDYRLKMSDPVNWSRRDRPLRRALQDDIRELIRLRATHPALARDEVDFFYFHPTFNDDGGVRVFAYCRGGGQPRGSAGQVVVIANCGDEAFPRFTIPWAWQGAFAEHGAPPNAVALQVDGAHATLSLMPGDVRVFTT